MQAWSIAATAIVYLLWLFAIAYLGDRRTANARTAGGRTAGGSMATSRPGIHALSLAVYCTSWTFFGSVGVAAGSGLSFLAIYLGPILVFTCAPGLIERVIRLAKAENLTSIADFIGARYGKNPQVAAIATVIALVGAVPYIALQLKAISTSVSALVLHMSPGVADRPPVFGDIALPVALALAVFAILFGTRHADATEHQNGLVLAVAAESIVKLAAFVAIGLFVCFGLFTPAELWSKALASPEVAAAFSGDLDGNFVAAVTLSAFAILLLPRQFHMTVVENRTRAESRRARWLFPLYLVAINLFVVPIAAAGLLTLGPTVDADLYVLALPLEAGQDGLSIAAFIGGLSAATAMVIVDCVALSIMVSNDLVLPVILKRGGRQFHESGDATRLILGVRRAAILAIVLFGYAYYRLAGDGRGLASIGLLSFAAIVQFAPAFLLGLLWTGGNARGAKAGLISGIAVWAYTLLLPAVAPQAAIVTHGLFGLPALRPHALFGLSLDPLLHGVLLSLSVNTLLLVAGSLSRRSSPRERIQASIFVRQDGSAALGFRRPRADVTVGELKATIGRYLGEERTERSFKRFVEAERRAIPDAMAADGRVMGFAEHLLGSAIGSASSRLVLSLLLRRHKGSGRAALSLLDDASEALQYNRDVLRIALDQVGQGLAVFDEDFCLTFWNRKLGSLMDLPDSFGRVGTPLSALLQHLNDSGEIDRAEFAESFDVLTQSPAHRQMTMQRADRVIDIRSHPMPEGGVVVTVSDITERVRHAAALSDLNETLEERVRRRTQELVTANAALAEARQVADAANIGKTRFLAAAGHDILQPLNAARLYAAALQERHAGLPGTPLAANIASALDSVETILGAVLDISRLDAGGMVPTFEDFPVGALFAQIETDLSPLAAERGVRLVFVKTSALVRSDRNLLRRLLQNLVSNAVKYTKEGTVVVGVRRRRGGVLDIEVVDSGIGIPQHQLQAIFEEFVRLDEGSRTAGGLGLGLSIVDRLARVLDHKVIVASEHGSGTRFKVTLPRRFGPALPAPAVFQRPSAPARGITGMLALVIDNEPEIREAMATLLNGWGCETLLAHSMDEAESVLGIAGRCPDVALVDYHLDGSTGIEAIARLRWRFAPSLSAILITADRSAAVREAAASLRVDILSKPLKPASLRAQMSALRVSASADNDTTTVAP